MSKLEKMRERLNKLNDTELLEVAKELLTEMADVHRIKEQIAQREASFTEGKRAAFFFFAQSLQAEELMHAASTATGRIRVLKEKKERADRKAVADEEKTEEEIAEDRKPINSSSIKSTFGGLGSSFDS